MDLTPKVIAKIENEFVMKAHYSLSATEQKLILYLASRINPQEDEAFHQQIVPIKYLEKLLSDKDTKRWGSVYAYLENVCDSLLSQTIRFKQPLMLNNKKRIIKGGINWFQHILIVENEKKEKSIEFKFSDMMRPFLLELNKYVRLNTLEVMDLKGKYSVRMYQVFKSERERTRRHREVSILEYDLGDFRDFLGLVGKYKALAGLRRRVIEPLVDEINAYSQELEIDIKYLKSGKRVVAVQFLIKDKPNQGQKTLLFDDFIPNDKDIAKLTYAQYRAYLMLVEYGVREGIAYEQIIPDVSVGEMEGYEDIFLDYALSYFEQNTNQITEEGKAGAFVKWWSDKKVFSTQGDVYWKIHERAYAHKKGLSDERRSNRELAKGMNRGDFLKVAKG